MLCDIVNQEQELDDGGWHGTALHYAIEKNDLQAARILLQNGATIDKPDSSGRTALMSCSDREMITLLVQHGASLADHFSRNSFDWLDWTADTFTEVTSAYSQMAGQGPLNKLPAFLPATWKTRESFNCEVLTIYPIHILSILEAEVDLNGEFSPEMSFMHLAMARRASSTFLLNSDLSFENTAPFPWHMKFWPDLSFLDSMYRHFRKKLTHVDFARIAHLEPARGLSPLCIAVTDWTVEMVRNCLSLGADVDFEGSPHGSALVLACALGNLEAVRVLVRAGASLSYQGEHGHKNVFTFCRSKDVRRWLLVERFTEQGRIDSRPQWGDTERVRPWAGTAMARLKLVGDRAMCYHETMMEYAERLARMRKEWRGKAIPPICVDGILYGSYVCASQSDSFIMGG